MGNRLSRLYTRTGDDGTTGLAGGDRVNKDSARISAIGAVDELNSSLGLLLSAMDNDNEKALILQIQHHLFNIGGELSMPGHTLLDSDLVSWLESNIDRINNELGPLEEFILPGGSHSAAICHLSRAIARRAEREVVALRRVEETNDCLVQYLNRLSDFLFAMARHLNHAQGCADIYWDKSLATPDGP